MTSRGLLLVAALIDILAPVAAAGFVLFGGATIGNCHPPVDASPLSICPVQVVVWPPLRTDDGIAVSLAISGVAWLAASYVVIGHLVRTDRSRLIRLVLWIGVAATVLAGVGFARGLEVRLRYAAEGAITWGLAGVVLGWLIAVAWVGLRPGDLGRRPIPRSTGRP